MLKPQEIRIENSNVISLAYEAFSKTVSSEFYRDTRIYI